MEERRHPHQQGHAWSDTVHARRSVANPKVPNQLLVPKGAEADVVTFPVFLPGGLTVVRT